MQKNKAFYWELCVFLSMFMGFRYRVGGDSLWYNNMFDEDFYPSLDELLSGYDFAANYFYPGWLFLNAMVKSTVGEFWGVQLLQALFVNIVCFYIFDKYCREQKYICLLVYYFFYFLYFNTEIMRESISASFFFLAYKYVVEKKWGKYYAVCMLAFLFHPSAVVVFVIPALLVFSYLLNRHFYIYYTVIVIMSFLLTYNIQTFISAMPTEFIMSKADYYMTRDMSFNGIVGTIIMKLLPVVALLPFVKKYLRRNTEENAFFKLYLIYLVISAFSIFTDGFYRLLNYFMPVMVILVAKSVAVMSRQRRMTLSKMLGIMAIIVMTLVQVRYYFFVDLVNIGKSEFKYYQLWYPYHSVLEGQSYKEREIMYFKSMGHY